MNNRVTEKYPQPVEVQENLFIPSKSKIDFAFYENELSEISDQIEMTKKKAAKN